LIGDSKEFDTEKFTFNSLIVLSQLFHESDETALACLRVVSATSPSQNAAMLNNLALHAFTRKNSKSVPLIVVKKHHRFNSCDRSISDFETQPHALSRNR
jgi:hypothetical protein